MRCLYGAGTLLLVVCVGCGPSTGSGEVPTVSEAAVARSQLPATTAASERTQTVKESEPSITQVVPAATVILGDITPAPATPAAPVEQPRPGIPNPITALVDRVSQDLSARLKVDASNIRMLQSEEVDWPDSGLGCPASGQGYAQVITPGYRLVLEAQGTLYTYHTDLERAFVLCQNGQPVE